MSYHNALLLVRGREAGSRLRSPHLEEIFGGVDYFVEIGARTFGLGWITGLDYELSQERLKAV